MALVCPATVTRTSMVPLPAGLVAVHWVVLVHCTLVAAAVPKLTVVAPTAVLKFMPPMVTCVPPVAGPLVGLRPLTVGAAVGVGEGVGLGEGVGEGARAARWSW